VFVSASQFNYSLIFKGKARSLPESGDRWGFLFR